MKELQAQNMKIQCVVINIELKYIISSYFNNLEFVLNMHNLY